MILRFYNVKIAQFTCSLVSINTHVSTSFYFKIMLSSIVDSKFACAVFRLRYCRDSLHNKKLSYTSHKVPVLAYYEFFYSNLVGIYLLCNFEKCFMFDWKLWRRLVKPRWSIIELILLAIYFVSMVTLR